MGQASGNFKDSMPYFNFSGTLAVMDGQREALVFNPQTWEGRKALLQSGLPLLYTAPRLSPGEFRFSAMIADDACHLHTVQSGQGIRPGAPRDNDARIPRRQQDEQAPGAVAHSGSGWMRDNGRQCSIEVKRAQGLLLRQPLQDSAGSTREKILHHQVNGATVVRSISFPATRS